MRHGRLKSSCSTVTSPVRQLTGSSLRILHFTKPHTRPTPRVAPRANRATAAPALVARRARTARPRPPKSPFSAAPSAMLSRDGIGTPPINTLPLDEIVMPTMGPIGGSLGLGLLKTQCLVMSTRSRPARAPSIHTLDEPRNTSYIGKKPPHQIAR